MSDPPGGAGIPVLGDKSVEFYRDAVMFVQKHIDKYLKPVFLTRFLNQPTVFVCSNLGVREVFADENSSFDMGYKQFMHGIYGDNILFMEGDDCQRLRCVLQHALLSDQSISMFKQCMALYTADCIASITPSTAIPTYALLKVLCTKVCLAAFLGLDFHAAAGAAEEVVSLTTAHWHGIVSVPVNVKVPLTNKKSTYGKAITAKKQLLSIINEHIEEKNGEFPKLLKEKFGDTDAAATHVLLLTSALVPKAMSSILTSTMIILSENQLLGQRCISDPHLLDCVLLEVMRLYPPFLGGRRVATKSTVVDGFTISPGQAVLYITRHAQRDPTVFKDPDHFSPQRWNKGGPNEHDRDKLFVFGGGSRCCIGQRVVMDFLTYVILKLLEHFKWELPEGQSLKYKWLPVCRPEEDPVLIYHKKSSSEQQ